MNNRRLSRRREERAPGRLRTLEWRNISNRYPPTEILSEDHLEAIHSASLRLLRDAGIKFLSTDARKLFKSAGAEVDESDCIVRFDGGLVEDLVAKAPDHFTVKGRNPDHSIAVGGPNISFATVGGPSFVSDFDNGRRSGTLEDFRNFVKVAHQLKIFHICGANVLETMEIPAESRHLDKYLSCITLHDKLWMTNMLGAHRVHDSLNMQMIVHGIDRDELIQQPLTIGNININSPRQVDESMSDALIEMAKARQPVIVTPFTLLGAMAPTTMAGSLVQQNAEALSCLALAQIVNPGTPVVYGSFASNVDMRTGSPAFGTPEYVRTTLASGQLARRYGLPLRTSGCNASNMADEQSTYETSMSCWAALLSHTNLVMHAGGWLEGGLVASFEKLIIDAEILQMMSEMVLPIPVNEDTLAVDAIAEVAPGGHFFGSMHTMERYENAFYTPLLSDWRNFETWQEDGAVSASKRANQIWKRLLREYEPPPIDAEVVKELEAYVARRRTEIEAGNTDAVRQQD